MTPDEKWHTLQTAQRYHRMEVIRQKLRDHAHAYDCDWDIPDALHDYVCDVDWLLNEVDRLRGKSAAGGQDGGARAQRRHVLL